jgi:hypothetical protein
MCPNQSSTFGLQNKWIGDIMSKEHSERIDIHGSVYYRKEGSNHRLDGPAVIHPDGVEAWYKEGQLHREDGPAIIDMGGNELWCNDGLPVVHKTQNST